MTKKKAKATQRVTVPRTAARKAGAPKPSKSKTPPKSSTTKTLPMTHRKLADPKATALKPAPAKAGSAKATPAAAVKPVIGKAAAAQPARAKPVADKVAPGKLVAGKGTPGKAMPGKPAPTSAKALVAAKPAAKGAAGKVAEDRTPAGLARAAMKNAASAKKAPPKKSPYSRSQLAPLRRALLELRLRMIGDLNQMEKEALRADDPDVDVENVADHGSDAFERHMTLGLMEGGARTLRQIGDALEAMDAGRYGLCLVCGEAVPLARLEALPFAPNCVPCQEAQERRQ